MTQALFDNTALQRNRDRARRMGAQGMFLHELAADQIEERLGEVNRRFISPAIVTAFPEIWKNRLPDACFAAESELLTLEEKAHDLVIHAFGLHAVNDPVGQLIQCRRALKPDGLFIAVTFGGQTLAELRSALAEAEASVSGGLSPRVTPMAELRDLGDLLMRADYALPVADSDCVPVSYQSLQSLMTDLRAMGETNALAARLRRFTRRDLFDAAQRIYQQHFPAPGNRINATFELVYLTGWARSDNQPQPLRPGSATARLADALGTIEFPADDPAP